MSLAGFSRNGSSPFLTFRQTCLVFGHLPNSYPQLGTRSSQIKGSVRAQQVTAGGIRHDKLDKRSPREGQEHFVSNLSLHLEAVRMGGKCSGTMGSPRKSPEFSTAQRLEMTTYLTENALTGCWHPWEKGFFFFKFCNSDGWALSSEIQVEQDWDVAQTSPPKSFHQSVTPPDIDIRQSSGETLLG